ncbi:MAG: hypothetical protein HOW73_24895 [Polyangiaceae bacterium]|nr:hypothetical protein [Polyangiaceae bacterium]
MAPDPAETATDGSSAGSGYRVPKGTRFPGACVKCGRPDGLTAQRKTFSYVSPTVYVAFSFGCVGMVVGAFFYFLARKTMDLTIPTCSRCRQVWDRASRWPPMFFAGSLVATLVATISAWKAATDRLWLPMCVGLAATLLGTFALHSRSRKSSLWAKSIDESAAVIVGIHPTVVAELRRPARSNVIACAAVSDSDRSLNVT